jgi:hypothetical protein
MKEFKRAVWLELDNERWASPTELFAAVRYERSDARWNNDRDWYRVALVLERLVNDGHVELKAKRNSSVRKYRRSAA